MCAGSDYFVSMSAHIKAGSDYFVSMSAHIKDLHTITQKIIIITQRKCPINILSFML